MKNHRMALIFACAGFTFLSAGCADTQADFRAKTPVLSLQSAKSARDVAICLNGGWSDVLNGFQMQPTQRGYTIKFVNSGLIYYMADVNRRTGGGSTTKYWVGTFTISHYIDELGNIVKRCQG